MYRSLRSNGKMKIGVITEQFQKNFKAENYLPKLKEIGFDGVDYTLSLNWCKYNEVFDKKHDVWAKHFKELKAAHDDAGMEVFQTHATFATNFDGERRLSNKCLDQYKKEIEATAILGSPYIVIHPINLAWYDRDKQEDFDANMEYFGKVEPVLREFGVKLGVENMFSYDDLRRRQCPTGCSTPEDMIKYIDSPASDRFVGCLDTGHMFIHGISPANAARKLGKRLKLMHVHDNYGTSDNHNAPGQGGIDWHDYAAALKEIGYDGVFSLETSFAPEMKIDAELGFDYAHYAYDAARKIVDMAEK